MDLALWRLARRAGEHRDLHLGTPPADLTARYRAGTLLDRGLVAFLEAYGQRGVAEVAWACRGGRRTRRRSSR